MRSLFTVEIQQTGASYPSDQDVVEALRLQAWDRKGTSDLDWAARVEFYKNDSEVYWQEMPEMAFDEKEYIIFCGKLQDNKTRVIVTRMVQGEANIRLINHSLGDLQSSTARVIKRITVDNNSDNRAKIRNNSVRIYERGHEHVVIYGNVIPSPLKEAARRDAKNLYLSAGTLILGIITLISSYLMVGGVHGFIAGNLERISTAMLTTFVVTAITFFQTYFHIRQHDVIHWKVFIDLAHQEELAG